ncbi:MAG: hypothetical protein ACAH89_04895 [Rariglobus sp.]|nr:hypothetical protein [Rariglobus sp.]
MQLSRPGLVRITFCCLVLAGGLSLARAEVQTLTDKQGRSLKADVMSVDGDKVKIKREDGQTFEIPLATLSDESQKDLKTWASKEASRPLPPGSLVVDLSRGVFDTEKKDSDVTLVGGDIVKNGRTTTEEKWGYSVTIQNKTTKPLENLRAEYRLFATVDNVHVKEKQGLKKKAYQSPISTIPELGRTVFRTETISAFKMKYNGNIVSAKTGDSSSRETLSGIWIRIYNGKDLVHEACMPDKLSVSETW